MGLSQIDLRTVRFKIRNPSVKLGVFIKFLVYLFKTKYKGWLKCNEHWNVKEE